MIDEQRARWVRDVAELIDDLRTQFVAIAMDGERPHETLCAFATLGHTIGVLSAHVGAATLDDRQYGVVFREINQIGMPEFFRRHSGDLAIQPDGRLRELCTRAGTEHP